MLTPADRQAIKELETLCQAFARHVDIVQATGGNASVKAGADPLYITRWIKASGVRLADMRGKASEGAVCLNTNFIVRKIGNSPEAISAEEAERFISPVISSAIIKKEGSITNLRPSIETAMHAVLDRAVLHVHPVVANAYLCSKKGKEALCRLFKKSDFAWINYVRPGAVLGVRINHALMRHRKYFNQTPSIIFLENHGLIVHAESASAVINKTRKVLDIFKEPLKMNSFLYKADPVLKPPELISKALPGFTHVLKLPSAPGSESLCRADGRAYPILYPDAAVFCGPHAINWDGLKDKSLEALNKLVLRYLAQANTEPKVWLVDGSPLCWGRNPGEAAGIAEVWWAHYQTWVLTKKLGGPRFLSRRQVLSLLFWEAEQYRQRLMQKS